MQIMQQPVFLDELACTDFEKARERLRQLAMRHASQEHRENDEFKRALRRAIEIVFQCASDRFTYQNVLKAKLIFGIIDQIDDERKVVGHADVSLDTYYRITGEDLCDLPHIRDYATNDLSFHLALREPLGWVALAWQIICNGTLVLTRERLMLL